MKTASGADLDARKVVPLVLCVAAGILLWETSVLWPLKMLVVMMHETGHAIASVLVGGSVRNIIIGADQSGQCLSSIPDGFLEKVIVYSAGYVGSALVGALLMVLTLRFRAGRFILAAASVWLAASFLYAGNLFTVLFCLGAAVALGLAAKLMPSSAVEWTNLFLAAFSSLYVVMDLKDDLWRPEIRSASDAQLLANVTIVPAVVWAATWTVFSLGVLAASAWWAVRAGKRRRLGFGSLPRLSIGAR